MAGCTTCGQPLRPGAYWCEFCATRVPVGNDRETVAPAAPEVGSEGAPAPIEQRPRPHNRRRRATSLPPPLHAPPAPPALRRRRRTSATSIFGWVLAAVIGVSLAGGAISSARDAKSEIGSAFEPPGDFGIPGEAVQTVAYESPSGLYALDFPIAVDGDTPTENDDSTFLTSSVGERPTHTARTNAIGVANYEVQEVSLPAGHPPAQQLATERCRGNDAGAVLTEIEAGGGPAWQCQWQLPTGIDANEVLLVVGDTALLLRGIELPGIFDASPFNAMVNSLQILRPN